MLRLGDEFGGKLSPVSVLLKREKKLHTSCCNSKQWASRGWPSLNYFINRLKKFSSQRIFSAIFASWHISNFRSLLALLCNYKSHQLLNSATWYLKQRMNAIKVELKHIQNKKTAKMISVINTMQIKGVPTSGLVYNGYKTRTQIHKTFASIKLRLYWN